MQTTTTRTTVRRDQARTWSPGQLVAGLIGGGLTVVGGVTLLRSASGGLTSLTETATHAGWLAATPLFSFVLLMMGAACLSAASVPTIRRAGATTLGATMVLFAVVGLVETQVLTAYLGVTTSGLVTYLVAGGALMAASWWTPVIASERHAVARDRPAGSNGTIAA